jgi:hypothetical protein
MDQFTLGQALRQGPYKNEESARGQIVVTPPSEGLNYVKKCRGTL